MPERTGAATADRVARHSVAAADQPRTLRCASVARMIESHDDTRPRDDAASLRRDLIGKLYFELAKFPEVATRNDHFLALAYAVRDRVLHRWVDSARDLPRGQAPHASSTCRPSS